MFNLPSIIVLSCFSIFVSANEMQLITRNSTSIQSTSHFQAATINSTASTVLSCHVGCYGFLDFSAQFTGTPVSIDSARTTGPPNCESTDIYLGRGYNATDTPITVFYYDMRLSYSVDNGACMLSTASPAFGSIMSIAPNLDVYDGDTMACLRTGYTTISSYWLVNQYLSKGTCTGTSSSFSFSSPIIFNDLDLLTTSLSSSYLMSAALTNMPARSCNALSTSATIVDGCTKVVYATMDIQGYWRGVQLTYDKERVTSPPNCANKLQSLGPGFTWSSTHTTIMYQAGGIDLGTGKDMFTFVTPHFRLVPLNTISSTDSIFLTTDGQTIGCLSSLYSEGSYFTIITTYRGCSKQPSSATKTMTLYPPITVSDSYGFVLPVGDGRMSLAPEIVTQFSAPSDPTISVTSIPISTPTNRMAVPPSHLSSLAEPSPALPQTTKVILVVAVGAALVLVAGCIAFFLWKRFPATNLTLAQPNPIVQQTTLSRNLLRSWRAPLMMLGGLIAGIALAIGHYCFYSRIDQYPVDSLHVSQSWVLRIGNLFAFAVKISLATSISVTFVQLQWVRLRQRPFRIKDIDALSEGLVNIFSFADSSVWFRYPLVTLIALTCWLLPIIPVITPGAINVISSPYLNETYLKVPQLARNVSKWALNSDGNMIRATGSIPLYKTAWSTAILGNLLPVQFDYTNASYHLDFLGPAVQCSYANSKLTAQAAQVLGRRLIAPLDPYFSYSSWIPGDGFPYIYGCRQQTYYLDTVNTDRARIYIALNDGNTSAVPEIEDLLSLVNLTECALYNATYSVDFLFNNTQQFVTIQNIKYLNGISYPVPNYLGNDITQEYRDQANAYAGLMATLGSLLVGHVDTGPNAGSSSCTAIPYMNIDLNFSPSFSIDSPNATEVLQRGIEEIFRNMTISLLNKDAFIDDTSEPVLVKIMVDLLTYSFVSSDLILAYGVAIVITIICSVLGFHAFLINDGSYQNIFSTFVRATRNSELEVQEGDTGTDPCPSDVGQALVNLKTNKAGSSTSEGGFEENVALQEQVSVVQGMIFPDRYGN